MMEQLEVIHSESERNSYLDEEKLFCEQGITDCDDDNDNNIDGNIEKRNEKGNDSGVVV